MRRYLVGVVLFAFHLLVSTEYLASLWTPASCSGALSSAATGSFGRLQSVTRALLLELHNPCVARRNVNNFHSQLPTTSPQASNNNQPRATCSVRACDTVNLHATPGLFASEIIARMPPRLVRRRPLWERITSALDPWDFFLWVSEEIETRELGSKSLGTQLGLALNFVFIIARSNGVYSTSSSDDVFGEPDSNTSGWLSYIVGLGTTFASQPRLD